MSGRHEGGFKLYARRAQRETFFGEVTVRTDAADTGSTPTAPSPAARDNVFEGLAKVLAHVC
jgi:hypothetical protein